MLKGYKVSTLSGERVGIAASSLCQLIEKACSKLKIAEAGVSVALSDGTVLDDEFFLTLDNQTHVVLLRKHETLHASALVGFVTALLKQWRGQDLKEGISALVRHLSADPSWQDDRTHRPAGDEPAPTQMTDEDEQADRSKLSLRSHDPFWFKDLSTTATTKEQYMRLRCATRVRTFFYRSREQLRSRCSSHEQRLLIERVLRCLQCRLRRNDAHAHYFDRSASRGRRMCDVGGVFQCAGSVDSGGGDCGAVKGCQFWRQHVINPYANRMCRVEFSTWNLDHRIERSRTVLPALLEAAASVCCEAGDETDASRTTPPPTPSTGRRINCLYFYQLLFGGANLSLVHVVCHNKRVHAGHRCDPALTLTPIKRRRVAAMHQPSEPEEDYQGGGVCIC